MATTSLSKPVALFGSDAHFVSGLSTTFRTGAAHAMERGAVVQDVVALHVALARDSIFPGQGVSVSTQMAALRRLLYGWESKDTETGLWFKRAAEVFLSMYCHGVATEMQVIGRRASRN